MSQTPADGSACTCGPRNACNKQGCDTCLVLAIGKSPWPQWKAPPKGIVGLIGRGGQDMLRAVWGDRQAGRSLIGKGNAGWSLPGISQVAGSAVPPPFGAQDWLDGVWLGKQKQVDIYISAGPKDGTAGCYFTNHQSCSIYRIRLELPASVLGASLLNATVELFEGRSLLDGGYGQVQAAVSPSGNRVAWHSVGDAADTDFIFARDLGEIYTASVYGASGRTPQPEFPNWYDEDTVLFHAVNSDGAAEDYKTLYSANASRSSTSLTFGTPTARLGPGTDTRTDISFSDVNTRRVEPVVGPGPGVLVQNNLVTWGAMDGTTELRPRVHALDFVSLTPGVVMTPEEFVLGNNQAGEPMDDCQHPAWNVSGDAILCMETPFEEYGTDGAEVNALYKFTRSGNTWTNAGHLFPPMDPANMPSNFSDLFPYDDPNVRHVYKYAEWCVSDNFVVATLFSIDLSGAVLVSRVILVQLAPLRYFDLTSVVERELGLGLGDLDGIYSTCAAASR